MVVSRGKRIRGRTKMIKGVKYMATEGDQTLGGEHTIAYTDVVL